MGLKALCPHLASQKSPTSRRRDFINLFPKVQNDGRRLRHGTGYDGLLRSDAEHRRGPTEPRHCGVLGYRCARPDGRIHLHVSDELVAGEDRVEARHVVTTDSWRERSVPSPRSPRPALCPRTIGCSGRRGTPPLNRTVTPFQFVIVCPDDYIRPNSSRYSMKEPHFSMRGRELKFSLL
jgi:hypothetical protein